VLDLPAERTLSGAFSLQAHEAAQSAARKVQDRFGRADILVHLVGGWTGGKQVVDVNPNEVSAMLEQHLWTTLYLAQAFVPLMRANRWGRIVAVSSPHVANPLAQAAPYAMAKAAQEALLLTLAQELKGTGITSNILLVRAIDAQHERDRNPTAHNAGWTTPEEISAAVLYLCSEAAHVVNGARIPLFEQ
jgi:NAD(P)-dependent dehydrogenase (short-subunit alcohol dehydrogenase family)